MMNKLFISIPAPFNFSRSYWKLGGAGVVLWDRDLMAGIMVMPKMDSSVPHCLGICPKGIMGTMPEKIKK